MKEHAQHIAQRSADAETWLVSTIAEAGKINHKQALAVAKAYKKTKLVVRDAYHSRYLFKTGALLDADVIARAVHNLGL